MELPLLSLVVMVARGRGVMGRRSPSFSVSAAPLEERRMSNSSLPRAAAKAKDYATHTATQSLIKRSRSCCSTITVSPNESDDPMSASQYALPSVPFRSASNAWTVGPQSNSRLRYGAGMLVVLQLPQPTFWVQQSNSQPSSHPAIQPSSPSAHSHLGDLTSSQASQRTVRAEW
jgi:hypothetical protein